MSTALDTVYCLAREAREQGCSAQDASLNQQRRQFLNQVEAVAACLERESNRGLVLDMLAATLDAERQYFRQEERHLIAIGFPEAAIHRRAHQYIEEKCGELYQSAAEGRLPFDRALVMICYLVVDHVRKDDRQYMIWLINQKQTAARLDRVG